jgi:hypothetical protein
MAAHRRAAAGRPIVKHWKYVLLSLAGSASLNAWACYTVYDHSGAVLYNEAASPVDMSRPLHETLPARFPGGHMVFDTQGDCASVAPFKRAEAPGGTPLLTDRRTAQSMNVPYTVLARGIVLVQPSHARLAPGLTVIPAKAVAVARPSRGTVITELRDPPLTIVQSGDGVVMSELSRR